MLKFNQLIITIAIICNATSAFAYDSNLLTCSTEGLTVTCAWESVDEAANYKLFYTETPYTETLPFNIVEEGDALQFSHNLWEGASFDIQIVAYNEAGVELNASAIETITTITLSLQPPTLSIPTAETGDVSLSWTPVAGATGYMLYYALATPDTSEEELAYERFDMKTKSEVLTSSLASLPDNSAYYVKIIAYNQAGESEYSNTELFTFGASPLPTEECNSSNLALCDSTTCSDAGGYWWSDDTCNEVAQTQLPLPTDECNSSNLALCDSTTCSEADGYWWSDDTCNEVAQPQTLFGCIGNGFWTDDICYSTEQLICDSNNLSYCDDDSVGCDSSGGFWYDGTCYESWDPASITDGEYTDEEFSMSFNLIPSGTFMMGSFPTEPNRNVDEDWHEVTLTRDYYMQTTEVTQKQWRDVMDSSPSQFGDCDDCPVENVSWNDIQGFIIKLNNQTGHSYRLPTEAEWEYAARAATSTAYSFGDDPSDLGSYAWYGQNSEGKTHPVSDKESNDWGLYGMHGNVEEFCSDLYTQDLGGEAAIDPTGPSSGEYHSSRGGNWLDDEGAARLANRRGRGPDVMSKLRGFRLVLPTADICNRYHVDECGVEADCVTHGGSWYDGVCNEAIDTCSATNLEGCSETRCSDYGYWWTNGTCNSEEQPLCESGNLDGCLTSDECSDFGFWWDDTCHAEAEAICNSSNLELCTDVNSCENAGGNYWSDNNCYEGVENLQPPSNVTLESYTGGVVITWDSVSGADSYQVYRSASLEESKIALPQDESLIDYKDRDVEPGVEYFYWVKAVNTAGTESDFSSYVSGSAR